MEFAIKLVALSWCNVDELGSKFHESLDGTLTRRDGEWHVTVYQEGPSARDAAMAAIEALEKLEFSVRRVDRDLVDIPEIALRLGRKRQNVHQFVTGARRAAFPLPFAYLGGKRVWMWSEIAAWARDELAFVEEPGLDYDDATFVDSYLCGRRDKVNGKWSVALHRSQTVSSTWASPRATPDTSYERKGPDVMVAR